MRIPTARRPAAFAVLIALVAVTVLTIMAGAFAYSMKVETQLAANTSNDEEFYWIGRAGVERACWWLAVEGSQPYSSLQQYWAGGPGDGPETNTTSASSMLASESLEGFQVGEGTVSIKMVELESKININTADQQLIKQVLSAQSDNNPDPNALSEVPDCILDWIDPDDNTRPAGAESDYYLGLTPSYQAKNAPIDVIEELLLVKGITTNMFKGTPPDENTNQFPEHELGFGRRPTEEVHYQFGLRDVFTPFSTGKINLLTANENVLKCLPGLGNGSDSAAVDNIINARQSDPPIRNISQLLAAAGIDPQSAAQMTGYLDVRGNTYEVHATATIGTMSHEYIAVVCRNGPNVQIFSFYRLK